MLDHSEALRITSRHRNERDVEVPAVQRFVSRGLAAGAKSLIDVGAYWSHAYYADSVRRLMGHKTYDGLDMVHDPMLSKVVDRYYVTNVCDAGLSRSHDMVTCVSAIEHSGIKGYIAKNWQDERIRVYRAIQEMSRAAYFLTFPYGMPALYPDEYANVDALTLQAFKDLAEVYGFQYDIEFYFNEGSTTGLPWVQVDEAEASVVPLDPAKGVRCVCLFEAFITN